MILAGGQGTRLGVLTKKNAKPAVPFGGKYRIIDFTLSNCTHSGLDTVGVLTQYEPLELNTYIGSGQWWDLDRNDGGVFVLPPYMGEEKGGWYKGTANAIYQNIPFIEQFDPKYVLILSGDHIYKMDYSKMIAFHKEMESTATIAVLPVALEDASRFGIMNTDEDGRIIEFEEKPPVPKSNLASMGVYVFNWDALKKYLMIDENNPKSNNDFGKNVIPSMLAAGEKMSAFRFPGYWKDVGTILSLWEANMDLLKKDPSFDLRSPEWKVYSRNPVMPPHYISETASMKNCYITEGCDISGSIENSILFAGVKVGKGSIIKDSIIMPGVTIGDNVQIEKGIIGQGARIMSRAKIGIDKEDKENEHYSDMCSKGIAVVGGNVIIDEGVSIRKNCMVEKDISKSSNDLEKAQSNDEEMMIS